MPNSIDLLSLHFSYPPPGEETPSITLRDGYGSTLAAISTREPLPELPLADGSVRRANALDVLEHVHDEQAWLGELNRVLVRDGELTVRLPLENWMAWADALNASRYLADITGVGAEPFETIPTGWHRHYAPDDLPALLELAGFAIEQVGTQGTPLLEIPQFAALVAGNVLGNHEPQRRVVAWLDRFRDGPRLPLPAKVAKSITVRARKVGAGFRPNPDLDDGNRPELDSDEPLE